MGFSMVGEALLTTRCCIAGRPSTLMAVVRLWARVFAANIAGTLLFSVFAVGTEAFSPELRAAFVELGTTAARSDSMTTTLHGVLAGWLIVLLVWITPSVRQARFFVIVTLTWLIALGKFAHVVAGSVEASFATMSVEIGWNRYAFGFLLPSLIGNVLGGVGLVVLINHAQVGRSGEGLLPMLISAARPPPRLERGP